VGVERARNGKHWVWNGRKESDLKKFGPFYSKKENSTKETENE